MVSGSLPLQEYAEFAAGAARRAGEIALGYFRNVREREGGDALRAGEGGHALRAGPPLRVEYKADMSPVTIADREGEQLLRRLLEESYPEHGILGEEFGATRAEAALRWYLDPIDGTQSFVRGVPLFGVMLGLTARAADGSEEQEALVGVVHLPALGETVVAWRGGGCWWNGVRAQVSATARLEDALLTTTDPLDLARSRKREAYERLRQRVKMERGWGDCYGHVLVATGRADIMLDAALNEWDAAPLLPIVEEAGGRFTDWRGRRSISGGDGFATNGALYEVVREMLVV